MSLKCLVRDFVMKTWCPMLWSTQGSGLLMSSQTMAQARRTRLKRALTEVTSDTVSYVRTVGNQSQIKHNTLYQNNIWSFILYRIPMAFYDSYKSNFKVYKKSFSKSTFCFFFSYRYSIKPLLYNEAKWLV